MRVFAWMVCTAALFGCTDAGRAPTAERWSAALSEDDGSCPSNPDEDGGMCQESDRIVRIGLTADADSLVIEPLEETEEGTVALLHVTYTIDVGGAPKDLGDELPGGPISSVLPGQDVVVEAVVHVGDQTIPLPEEEIDVPMFGFFDLCAFKDPPGCPGTCLFSSDTCQSRWVISLMGTSFESCFCAKKAAPRPIPIIAQMGDTVTLQLDPSDTVVEFDENDNTVSVSF